VPYVVAIMDSFKFCSVHLDCEILAGILGANLQVYTQ